MVSFASAIDNTTTVPVATFPSFLLACHCIVFVLAVSVLEEEEGLREEKKRKRKSEERKRKEFKEILHHMCLFPNLT